MAGEPSPFEERIEMPCDERAEKALLSAFYVSPLNVGSLCMEAGAQPEWFYLAANATHFATLMEMWQDGAGIDLVTVIGRLTSRSLIESLGGPAAVSDIATFIPTATNAATYIDTLRDKYTLRQVVTQCTTLAKRAQEEQDDVPALVKEMQGACLSLVGTRKKVRTVRDLIRSKMDRVNASEPLGDVLPTGLTLLDRHSPLRLGSMPVIAAERKGGKSILAQNIAAANAPTRPVIVFSLEDPADNPFFDRLTANVSGIPMDRHHYTMMSEEETRTMSTSLSRISKMKLTVRDDVFDSMTLMAVVRQWHAENQAKGELAGVAIVDYLQLLKGRARKQDNRETEVSGIARDLRLLAMELGIALPVVSQLNKDGTTRESAAIEMHCTALWKILEKEGTPWKRTIDIPFQRNGGSKVCFEVAFRGDIARFYDLRGEVVEDPQQELPV